MAASAAAAAAAVAAAAAAAAKAAMGSGVGDVASASVGLSKEEARNRYRCEECGKGFITPSKLQRHSYSHTGLRPFHCDVCGKSFSQAANLKTHIRNTHPEVAHEMAPPRRTGSASSASQQQAAALAVAAAAAAAESAAANAETALTAESTSPIEAKGENSFDYQRADRPSDRSIVRSKQKYYSYDDLLPPSPHY